MEPMYSSLKHEMALIHVGCVFPLQALEHGGLLEKVEGRRRPPCWGIFWAAHQRFFSIMCMASKVPAAARLAQAALEAGKCVVIGLQSTGEARTDGVVAQYGNELDDWVSGEHQAQNTAQCTT